MPAIIGPWVVGDGGPAIVLPEEQLPLWRGASDYEQSLMAGGDLETHYDIACRCTEWAESFGLEGIHGLCFAGDETPVAWLSHNRRGVLIRPIFSEHLGQTDVVSDRFIDDASVVAEIPFRNAIGRFRLLMAADSSPEFIYKTSPFECGYPVRMIETREYRDEWNHILFHVFRADG
jgi:hypothetical protein